MWTVEGPFVICILDHVTNERLFLTERDIFDMPQLNPSDRAQQFAGPHAPPR
jgi:hypothetical protein